MIKTITICGKPKILDIELDRERNSGIFDRVIERGQLYSVSGGISEHLYYCFIYEAVKLAESGLKVLVSDYDANGDWVVKELIKREKINHKVFKNITFYPIELTTPPVKILKKADVVMLFSPSISFRSEVTHSGFISLLAKQYRDLGQKHNFTTYIAEYTRPSLNGFRAGELNVMVGSRGLMYSCDAAVTVRGSEVIITKDRYGNGSRVMKQILDKVAIVATSILNDIKDMWKDGTNN